MFLSRDRFREARNRRIGSCLQSRLSPVDVSLLETVFFLASLLVHTSGDRPLPLKKNNRRETVCGMNDCVMHPGCLQA